MGDSQTRRIHPDLRTDARYQLLARILADEITQGIYPPGSKLPSETEMLDRYGVSRNTVRAAISELRNMGLAVSHHGKGTFVRAQTAPAAEIERTLTKRGKRLHTSDTYTAEPASVTRSHASGTVADLIGRGPVAVLKAERLLRHPATTDAIAHQTMIIPFDVADEVPKLAETPDSSPADLYSVLAAAGHSLTWREKVTARTALPDERAALDMRDSDTIMLTYRITEDADGRVLLLEELRVNADTAALAYRITPTTPKR